MFDNQTLAFLMQPGMVAALLAQFVNWRINRETPGVKWWLVGLALETAGIVLRAQPPFMPEAAIVPLANLLILGGQFVVLYGLCRFSGRPMFVKTAVAAVVLLPVGEWYFVAVDDSLVARTLLQVGVLAIAVGLQVSLLPPLAKREGFAAVAMLVVAYGTTILGFTLRLIFLLIFGIQPVGLLHIGGSMAITSPPVVVSMGMVALATAYSYGFILLVASHSRWQLRQVAIVDALTGVPNRRAFDSEVQHMLLRTRRSQGRLGLALMDLDHFKKVNDAHGHAAGDAFLRHFANVVHHTLRETDFFARVGGEEFALLLGDATLDSLQLTAERIRAALEQSPLALPHGNAIRTTVSIGIAASEPGGGEPEALYRAADSALYRAKTLGRNRVEIAVAPVEAAAPAAGKVATEAIAAPEAPAAPRIYTIGHAGDYDAALARNQDMPITKRGPYLQADGSQYYGGYAFPTVAEAQAYIDKLGKQAEWAVYEMDATWPADVWHPHEVEDFKRLNRDAVLLRKVGLGGPAPEPALSGEQPA